MKTNRFQKNAKWYALLIFVGLILGSCTVGNDGEDIKDPKDDGNKEILDLNAKGNCKTVKLIITMGEIRETYQITYNDDGKITQAVQPNGKYTFEHNAEGYHYNSFNAAGVLTNTKDVKLNSNGKPISYVEIIYDDKGEAYREQHNELTYTNGKLSEIKKSEDGYQIRLYKLFWENGNIKEIEDNGIIERRYKYYTNHANPTDGLTGVDLAGYLQTGIVFLDGNANLMKHSEVDTIISDITYQFNDHGKIVSQKIVRNDLSDPIYFTPTYSCN